MLTAIHPHAGQPVAPHDLWTSWNLDPALLLVLALAAVGYERGVRSSTSRGPRRGFFLAGFLAVVVALVSPLEELATHLASAHMVQHMLLVVAAGPLLAWSRPLATSLRAVPLSWRKAGGSWRIRAGLTPVRTAWLHHPVPAWLALAASVWLWHSSFMYGLALRFEAAHVLEHTMLLVSAVWFWNIALGGLRRPPRAVGSNVLMLFTIGLQGVLLSAMLTFAEYPWYREYLDTAPRWGLSPLEDQQLAGLIMWIPGGLVYTGAALAVIYRWIGTGEEADMGETGRPDPIYPS